ncbi:MAG TPA: EF-hand domain-containing protein [Sulfurovum sp.]|uniref:EF-hand domain-containing protein n=1 Tax=Sulfurovum sp. TaxID=1969726 RepID=UPI002F92B29C
MKKLMIVALFATGVWAADQPAWVADKPTFSEFDLNKDGKIIKSELDEAREIRMKKRADEGRMLRNAGEAHSFNQIDVNKDGAISEEEFLLHQKMHHNQGCVTFG